MSVFVSYSIFSRTLISWDNSAILLSIVPRKKRKTGTSSKIIKNKKTIPILLTIISTDPPFLHFFCNINKSQARNSDLTLYEESWGKILCKTKIVTCQASDIECGRTVIMSSGSRACQFLPDGGREDGINFVIA